MLRERKREKLHRIAQPGTSRKRLILASLLAAALLFLLIGSCWILAEEACHECTGEDCEVCAFLEECRANIRRAGNALTGFFACLFLFFSFPEIIRTTAADVRTPRTLIAQKVRLDM